MMDGNIAASELLRTIFDRQWHELYEVHARYRLSPIEIYEAVTLLQRMGIIEQRGTQIRICEDLDEQRLSIMNRLSKTSRPAQLDSYVATPLTFSKKRVTYIRRTWH